MNTKYKIQNTKYFNLKKSLTIIVAILLVGIYFFKLSSKSLATWYDDNFAYRQKITIGNTGAAVSNQKVLIQVDTATLITAGKMQSDCDDTRFTDINGKVLQYYISVSGGVGVGCNDASTDFYVLLPTINAGNTIIYMYYGNPSAASGSQKANFSQATFSPTSGPTAATEEKGPGPVAYWRFDEGYGSTAQDSTINNNDGTLGAGSSAPTWTEESRCVSGKCLQFDGVNDYVSVPDSNVLDGTAIMTWMGWVKFNNTSNTVILSKRIGSSEYSQFAISVYLSNLYCIQSQDGSSNGTSVNYAMPSTNVWHHIVCTNNGTTAGLYIDGKLVATDSTPVTSLASASNDLWIGTGRVASTTVYHTGFIDEPKIYNYARTAAQIKADFSKGAPAKGGPVLGAADTSALSNGLVGYWKMDESSGNTCTDGAEDSCDSSGNANDMLWNADATTTTGKFGNGVTFDGTGDYLCTSSASACADASNFDSLTDLSLSVWVKPTTVSGTKRIIAKTNTGNSGTGHSINLVNDTVQFNFRVSGNTSVTTGSVLTAGVWQHIVAVRKSDTTMQVFVNGVLQATGNSASGAQQDATGAEIIGCDYLIATCFTGSIDEARVYSRALSPGEVRQLYNFAPGPVSYLKMDEGSGTSAQDSSGNAHTGTLNGNYSWKPGKYGKGVKLNGSSGDNVSVGDIGY